MLDLSIIICTYNPKQQLLARALDALKAQTLNVNQWELVIIDNQSEPAVPTELIRWHPNGRVIREERLGLTQARLRGMRETSAPALVFVDDDAVLNNDYLSEALWVARTYPQVGVFGGNISLDTEIPIPDFYRPHLALLAERRVEKNIWGCLYHDKLVPPGVGMVVQRDVAEAYTKDLTSIQTELDRKGNLLTSGGDNDIAYTACDRGRAIGLFKNLHLIHLIPRERLTKAYMLRLMESISFSSAVLASTRPQLNSVLTKQHRLLKLMEYILAGKFTIPIALAKLRGQQRAKQFLKGTTK
jgi:glycosyltransferase involved in cell wall biosynthesis